MPAIRGYLPSLRVIMSHTSHIKKISDLTHSASSVVIPPLELGGAVKRPTYLPHNMSMGNLHAPSPAQKIDFLK